MSRRANDSIFVIAEAGVNHNGSDELAHQLIEKAAQLGANAIKFQTFDPEALLAHGTQTVDYQKTYTGHEDQFAMLSALALPIGAWAELAIHAAELNLEFMSTAFDESSLSLLLELGVRRLKVPSGELTNLPFVRKLASHELPLVISTGMGTLAEVEAALDAAQAAPAITVLHCVSAYPAPLASANLAAITTIKNATGCAVGWSDHCSGTIAVAMAVALGATMVERHLTLDKSMEGPDHAASDNPEEFAMYLNVVREASIAVGNGVKAPDDVEAQTRLLARRSWHARRDIDAGDLLSHDDIVALRPASGIAPSIDIVGRRAAQTITSGVAIETQMLEDSAEEVNE